MWEEEEEKNQRKCQLSFVILACNFLILELWILGKVRKEKKMEMNQYVKCKLWKIKE